MGNAFRAPPFTSAAASYGPDLSKPGVKALDAERSHNAEIGLKFALGDHETNLTTYRNRVDNLIIFGAGSCGSSFGCYENVSRALLRGSVAQPAASGSVNLSATLDFQSPTDASTGNCSRAAPSSPLCALTPSWPGGRWVPLCRPPASALTMPPTPTHWLAMPRLAGRRLPTARL